MIATWQEPLLRTGCKPSAFLPICRGSVVRRDCFWYSLGLFVCKPSTHILPCPFPSILGLHARKPRIRVYTLGLCADTVLDYWYMCVLLVWGMACSLHCSRWWSCCLKETLQKPNIKCLYFTCFTLSWCCWLSAWAGWHLQQSCQCESRAGDWLRTRIRNVLRCRHRLRALTAALIPIPSDTWDLAMRTYAQEK